MAVAFQHEVRSLVTQCTPAAVEKLSNFFSKSEPMHRKEFIAALFGRRHCIELEPAVAKTLLDLIRTHGFHRELAAVESPNGSWVLQLGSLANVSTALAGHFLEHTHPHITSCWQEAIRGYSISLEDPMMETRVDATGPWPSLADIETLMHVGRQLAAGFYGDTSAVVPGRPDLVYTMAGSPTGGYLAIYSSLEERVVVGVSQSKEGQSWLQQYGVDMVTYLRKELGSTVRLDIVEGGYQGRDLSGLLVYFPDNPHTV